MQPKRIPWNFKHPFRLGFRFFWKNFVLVWEDFIGAGSKEGSGIVKKSKLMFKGEFFTEGPKLFKNSHRERLKINLKI